MRRDCAPDELQPGEYAKGRMAKDGFEFDVWWVCTPNGLIGRLSAPLDLDRVGQHHHVEEHDDGEITVMPQLGNSNSIMVTGWPFDGGDRAEGEPLKSWHGYIDHGEWKELP